MEVVVGIVMSWILVFVGFGLGVLTERMAWNKLIRKGIIPAPKNR